MAFNSSLTPSIGNFLAVTVSEVFECRKLGFLFHLGVMGIRCLSGSSTGEKGISGSGKSFCEWNLRVADNSMTVELGGMWKPPKMMRINGWLSQIELKTKEKENQNKIRS